ncbi:gustatory receptor for sugar taste 64a-like [Pectinophora gossypiella]|uniref:gustatory receptor for sugar taste 64a-like n=1 Tax=Pectinophora gossypiella TaxID=13191 RepID=UPI00214EE127|nr:gustatory receptor for sugar taste 64a-like [Pectinophora gossypiella]
MRKVFIASSFFGVAGPKKNLWRLWGVLMILLLLAIQVGAIYKLIKLLAGLTAYSVGNRSVTARLAGTMFYSASFFSLVFCWRLSSSWNKLSVQWASVEKRLSMIVPSDQTLKKRMIMVSCLMAFGALVEHTLSILACTEFDTPPSLLLEKYILTSHGFILVPTDYSNWIAVPLFFMSNIATILWGFQDLLIVLVSMGLTSRYHRLNQCVAKISMQYKREKKCCKYAETLRIYTWRKIRESYVKQALLVRKVDASIGSLILLSSSGNFYFICLQLFLGITQGISGAVIKRLYYLLSLAWLCVRFGCVVLAAADVNVNSKKALRYLHSCANRVYNTEVERLAKQLTQDFVALSGMGFFYIDRGMLLQACAWPQQL